MADDQRQPIVLTTARPVQEPAKVQVQPLIEESALKQLVQLYGKPQGQAQVQDEPLVASNNNMDSVVQFQDRHKTFLKRPTQEKYDQFAALKQHEKKKVAEDLMNVGLEWWCNMMGMGKIIHFDRYLLGNRDKDL